MGPVAITIDDVAIVFLVGPVDADVEARLFSLFVHDWISSSGRVEVCRQSSFVLAETV